MWKSIATNDRTWVRFKSNFQEAYLDKGYIEQMKGERGYGSANNVNHVEMEDAFMSLVLEIAAQDADYTKLMTMNSNLPTRLIHKEDQNIALQAEW